MSEKSDNFISYLWDLDRKGFATLRRSLSEDPGQALATIPYIEPFAISEKSHWKWQMYYLVAGLFCFYERPLEHGQTMPAALNSNMGESMANLYLSRDRSNSIEQRFVRLLDADSEQLPDRMRQVVALLRSEQIPVGWEALLEDLCFWNREDRRVQHRWARGFYLRSTQESQSEELDQDTEDDGGDL